MGHLIQMQQGDVNFLLDPRTSELQLAQDALREYDRKISDIRGRIKCLQEEERLLEQEALFYQAVLSPVRKMPEEILCKIFLLCLPALTQQLGSIDPSMAPIVLTQVCRRWRMIATDFSPLWGNVWLVPKPSTVGTPEAIGRLVGVLKRSRNAPLNLQIHWKPGSLRWNLDKNFLASFSSSLTRLTLLFEHQPYSVVYLASIPSGQFPRLERLNIAFPSPNMAMYEGMGCIVAFRDALNLSHAAINCWIFDPQTGTTRIDLPWRQLTHFSMSPDWLIEDMTTQFFLRRYLVECGSSLRYLALPLFHPNQANWAQNPALHFENLESFTMRFDPSGRPWLLYILGSPRLSSLRFESCNRTFAPAEVGYRFWEAVNMLPGLLHLSLDHIWDQWHLFDHPNIQTLDFTATGTRSNRTGQTNGILNALTRNPPYQPLPQLRNFILRVMEADIMGRRKPGVFLRSEVEGLANLIESRTGPGISGSVEEIQKVAIHASHLVDRLALQRFINNGLIFQSYMVGPRDEAEKGWIEDHPCVHDWHELRWISD